MFTLNTGLDTTNNIRAPFQRFFHIGSCLSSWECISIGLKKIEIYIYIYNQLTHPWILGIVPVYALQSSSSAVCPHISPSAGKSRTVWRSAAAARVSNEKPWMIAIREEFCHTTDWRKLSGEPAMYSSLFAGISSFLEDLRVGESLQDGYFPKSAIRLRSSPHSIARPSACFFFSILTQFNLISSINAMNIQSFNSLCKIWCFVGSVFEVSVMR